MRYFVLAALLLACAGCANRTIAISYNPAKVDPATFPAMAEQECRKYGMTAEYQGRPFWTAYGYDAHKFWCKPIYDEPPELAPFGWWTWPRAEF